MSDGMRVGTAWVIWGFLALGALGGGALVVLDYAGILRDAPAWAQAFGGIGAILVAVFLAQRERVHQRREKARENYEYMQKAFGVAVNADAAIDSAAQHILKGATAEVMLKYHVTVLEMALEDLRGIDQTRLDDLTIADAFVLLKRYAYLSRTGILLQAETGGRFNLDEVSAWGANSSEQIHRMTDAMIHYLSRHPRLA